MPEFIPPITNPTGLAEQLIALKSRAGDPWAALAQNLGQTVSGVSQAAKERQAQARELELKKTQTILTPDQQRAFGITVPAPGPTQPGQPGPQQTSGQNLPVSLAEKMVAAKTASDKTLGQFASSHTVLNQEQAEALSKKSGLPWQAGQAAPNAFVVQEGKQTTAPKAPSGAQEAQWTQLFRLTNPSAAMRGTPLGVAAIANQRANRALEILDDEKMTPQRKSLAITDLAGIIQGGSPHEQEIASQNYGAYQDMWKNLVQKITAQPQIIDQPETVAEIRDLVRGVKGIDNDIIKSNLEESENFFSDRIKAHGQEKWDKYKKQVLSSLDYGMKDEKDKSGGKGGGLKLPSSDDIDAELKRRGGS